MSEIFVIDAESLDGVKRQLEDAQKVMQRNLNKAGTRPRDNIPDEVRKNVVRKDPTCFAVIINGHSLVRKQNVSGIHVLRSDARNQGIGRH